MSTMRTRFFCLEIATALAMTCPKVMLSEAKNLGVGFGMSISWIPACAGMMAFSPASHSEERSDVEYVGGSQPGFSGIRNLSLNTPPDHRLVAVQLHMGYNWLGETWKHA
jgi:hypothetical protein